MRIHWLVCVVMAALAPKPADAFGCNFFITDLQTGFRTVGLGSTFDVDVLILSTFGPQNGCDQTRPTVESWEMFLLFDDEILQLEDVLFGEDLGGQGATDRSVSLLDGVIGLQETSLLEDAALAAIQSNFGVLLTLRFSSIAVTPESFPTQISVSNGDAGFPPATRFVGTNGITYSGGPGLATSLSVIKPVPLPASIMLLLSGGAFLGFARRRVHSRA